MTRKTQKLSETLGVSIHHNQYSGISMYQYGNINCGAFSMSFSNSSREPEMFIVDRLKGRYTSEEIKKIIQIVGSNPRAIAQRLTNT